MRKTFSALVALAALSGTAFAADLPVRKAPAAPEYAVDWTGFTVGIVGGGGWADAKPDFGGFKDPGYDGKLRGWVAGAYVGYNWQVASSLVVGIEGDYTQADINNSQTISGITVNTKLDRLGTIRGRVGFLMNPNLLVYGTGGLALGSAQATATVPLAPAALFDARGNHWGWTAGLGAEYSLGAKLKLRLEYLHYDLREANYASGVSLLGGANINASLTAEVVRAGLGFQF